MPRAGTAIRNSREASSHVIPLNNNLAEWSFPIVRELAQTFRSNYPLCAWGELYRTWQ